jgi:hypothetical protein
VATTTRGKTAGSLSALHKEDMVAASKVVGMKTSNLTVSWPSEQRTHARLFPSPYTRSAVPFAIQQAEPSDTGTPLGFSFSGCVRLEDLINSVGPAPRMARVRSFVRPAESTIAAPILLDDQEVTGRQDR